MRPRVFPAEDALRLRDEATGKLTSMRPRVFPAEDVHCGIVDEVHEQTSMRPRVFPAEDTRKRPQTSALAVYFNEAAGIPRGRHKSLCARGQRGAVTSMRPRVFPAEDVDAYRPVGQVPATSMRPRVFPAEDRTNPGPKLSDSKSLQ